MILYINTDAVNSFFIFFFLTSCYRVCVSSYSRRRLLFIGWHPDLTLIFQIHLGSLEGHRHHHSHYLFFSATITSSVQQPQSGWAANYGSNWSCHWQSCCEPNVHKRKWSTEVGSPRAKSWHDDCIIIIITVTHSLQAVQAKRILRRCVCHNIGISQYLKPVKVNGIQTSLQCIVRREQVRVKRPRHPCHGHANVFH